jgi:hypothetical protein
VSVPPDKLTWLRLTAFSAPAVPLALLLIPLTPVPAQIAMGGRP